MLPSELQHQFFGELKSKHQLNPAHFMHNDFFFLFTNMFILSIKAPTGPNEKFNIFQDKLKKLVSLSHIKTRSVFCEKKGLWTDLAMAK